ncbi:chemotaxis protein CheW [Hydrogenophaga sp. 5NK40-0174]|uniref:chemotaxis protein CheW n=1 Tax=Hydrogenophaga sp. 5NK40-0174 TaxID=3127649 RepID=UPI0031069D4E
MSTDQVTLPDEQETDTTQVLTFHLGQETFAMNIGSVREIIQYGSITSVPLMPEFVRGVINLRGAVVPVIDLHSRFGRSLGQVGKKTCVVIFDASRNGERAEIGLLVDSVSEVVDVPTDSIEPAPGFGTTVRRDFIFGIGKIDGEFVTILDPEKAFDVDDMARLCESAQEAVAA